MKQPWSTAVLLFVFATTVLALEESERNVVYETMVNGTGKEDNSTNTEPRHGNHTSSVTGMCFRYGIPRVKSL